MKAFLVIILICILSSISYGIVHDQITARICIEYFTVGHPPVFSTDNPTLLGLGWGVIATWWMGLGLGIPMAMACQLGKRKKIPPKQIMRPIFGLLKVMALLAAIAGFIGFALAHANFIHLSDSLSSRIPEERHPLFLADAFAHSASYATGFFGGVYLIFRTWKSRTSV